MQEAVLKTFLAVKKQIDPNRRKYTFELFGFDFILDEDMNSWLIEVNTNPCLEESSKLLKSYLPRMIEDMLQLTVDNLFPKTALKRYKPKPKEKGPKETKPSTPDKPQRDEKDAGDDEESKEPLNKSLSESDFKQLNNTECTPKTERETDEFPAIPD